MDAFIVSAECVCGGDHWSTFFFNRSGGDVMRGMALTQWQAGLIVGLVCVFGNEPSRADSPSKKAIDFARDVFPVLQQHCIECHGPDLQEGQLRLDARALVRRGGINGKLFTPGKSDGSLLLQRLTSDDAGDRMPLEADPLDAKQIEVLRRWIDEGANWPDGIGSAATELEKHWAYIKPVRAALPTVSDPNWPQNPIDFYVLQRLDREGLQPAPAAQKERLLRRIYLDLIGLPPSPDQIDEFLADESPTAYEHVVDRLLASPQFGAKWARSWLDVARYADTNGYQADQFRSVWPYRDWVVAAMNADMQFDQFTIEQIAGDLLPNATVDQRIATGFHRLTTCNVEAGVDPEENRVNQIVDRVNTTGTVWLGTSIECGQCHSHKYDPISQRDYYGLFAYFNNTPLEVEGDGVTYNFVGAKMDLPLNDEQQQQRESLQTKVDELTSQLAERTKQLAARQTDWEKSLTAQLDQQPEWHPLAIDRFESAGGATHELLDDGSVLVGGKTPAEDDYTISATSQWTGITGFKIEALTDPSLPGSGPGRQNAERPNFVLQEFSVTLQPCDDEPESEPQPVSLHSARADYSHPQYKVADAIDGDPTTGWAIHSEFFKPHWATFLTSEPLGFDCGTRFNFELRQHHGAGRTIGRIKLWAMTGSPGDDAIPAAVVEVLRLPADKRSKKQQRELTDYHVGLDAETKQLREALAAAKKELASVEPETTLVMVEQSEPRETHLLKRGNFLTPGDTTPPGTPAALHPLPSDARSDRLGLARWLADSENPLTPRVMVNRWWSEIFGRGIVATVEDFGSQGDPPTHPELLDWLACEFRDNDWSMKHTLRLIVTSATYQQSSRVAPEAWQHDPENRLLARGPRFRLPAELVRDNALAVAGLVMTQQGGPPIYPPQPDGVWRHVGRNEPKYLTSTGTNRFRRGLYVVWRRSAPYPSFTNFDAPDRASCAIKRPVTNTPLQALTLLNDPVYIEIAAGLADRILRESPSSDTDARLRFAFRLATSREPKEPELEHLRQVIEQELARFRANPASAKTLLEGVASDGLDQAELAAWTYLA
ncbi:MAG: DUF1553 domain-containing protein, partial [Planctomycetales bacterium]|nr:DUF1553 domain-containing protein [Planctomycetales bacterium]